MPEKNTNPLVSIALCTFNGDKFIEEQIQSLLAQSYNHFEIIICDDNSSDLTTDIILSYSKHEPKIKVFLNTSNLGFNKNFKKAISLCSGEFIAPCDQDDIWNPDKIDTLLNAIGEKDLCYADSELINETGVSIQKNISSFRRMYDGHNPLAFLLTNCVSGHSMLVRKELLLSINIPDGLYYDWWIAIAACSRNGITYVDKPLVKFRRHINSASGIGSNLQDIKTSRDDFIQDKLRILSWIYALDGKISNDAKNLYDSIITINQLKSKLILSYTLLKNAWPILFIHSKEFLRLLNKINKSIFN